MARISDRTSYLLIASLIAFALALASLAGCCDPGPSPVYPTSGSEGRTPEQQAAAAAQVTCVCVSPTGNVDIGMGSGVLITEQAVLTASHVVDCAGDRSILVTFTDLERQAELAVVDLKADVALLHLEERALRAPPAVYGPRPQVDERVCIAAAIPSRGRSCGEVTAYDSLPGDVKHSALTEPGNSGSGVYDSRGRLVGIVTHFVRCSNGQYCGGMFSTVRGSR